MPTAYLSPSQLQDLTNVSSTAPVSGDNGKALVWNQAAGRWQAEQVAYSNLSGTPTLGTMASQNANAVAITGGSASNLSSIAVSGTSASTSTTTGALTVAGGVGIQGRLNLGGDFELFASSPNTYLMKGFANSTTGNIGIALIGNVNTGNANYLWLAKSGTNGWGGPPNKMVVASSTSNQATAPTLDMFIYANSNIEAATPNICVQANTNRVGINNTNPQSTLDVTGTAAVSGQLTAANLRVTASVPGSPTAAGTINEIRVDGEHIYVCTQSGSAGNAAWKRVAISTWTP